jgi:cytochrome oxidase Cu insertion factor (SCO1/SenC/PrrC family)/thiol-disulfide isomerase/thioredoxin
VAHPRRVTPSRSLAAGRWRARGLAAITLGLTALTAGLVVTGTGSPGDTATALASNPDLDPGTTLSGGPAPDFTLANQFGRTVSLSSFRGKVTILDFNDSECTTICPLTTAAMLEAKRMLGPAAAHVQLLGVDANPKATAVEDVLSYTQLHGLLGKWDFLTGSSAQLRAVWRAYGIEAEIRRGLISHTPALFVIDQQGRMRKLYMTQQSYSAVGQLGQILAREISRLLPSHPAVHSQLSYEPRPTIPPARSIRLPRVGAGHVSLGPGRAHLYVFFDTWDQEVTSLAGQLTALNRYASSARRLGLPPLTAIDEAAVEPSPHALPRFLRQLRAPLHYPVAIDRTGQVGDGYQVQGQPWMVLTSASGQIQWYHAVYTAGWPSLEKLRSDVRAALSRTPRSASGATAAQQSLIGSPTALARLHRQASRLLGAEPQLMQRIRALRGYPIVVNLWASWCGPCQAEFKLFASDALRYGRQVAFLGADTDDSNRDAAAFLAQHRVTYPSYSVASTGVRGLVSGGIQGLPTTVFIDRKGKVSAVHTGQYNAQGSLDADIKTQALNPGR